MYARTISAITLMLLCASIQAATNTALAAVPSDNLPSVETLQAQGDLVVEAWMDSASATVPSEQRLLNIRIRTRHSFSKGTHVGRFNIPDAAVLRRMTYADKEQLSLEGSNWQAESWQLEIYPGKPGYYLVPSIPVDMTVYLGRGNSSKGTLYTDPVAFEVSPPAGQAGKGQWFAAEQPRLTEQLVLIRAGSGEELVLDDPAVIKALKVAPGDSLVRTLSLEARGTASMLLPPSGNSFALNAEHFAAKPILSNEEVDGRNMAKRVERHTYLLTRSGSVELPGINQWAFDSQSRDWKPLRIEPRNLKVTGIPWQEWLNEYGLIGVFLLVGICGLAVIGRRISQASMPWRAQLTGQRQYCRAVHNSNHLQALDWLYGQISHYEGAGTARSLRDLDTGASWQQTLDRVMADLFNARSQRIASNSDWIGLWRKVRALLRSRSARPRYGHHWSEYFRALPVTINQDDSDK